MAPILRDNAADPRVDGDVRRLADTFTDEAVTAATKSDAWWRPSLAHVSRYRNLYAVAAIVLGLLLLRDPLPVPVIQAGEELETLASPDDVLDSAALGAAGGSEAVPPSLELAPAAQGPPPLDAGTPVPAMTSPPSPRARPLQIAQSGYASSFAGTPLEQPPPDNGLPTEALAGGVTKYSFVRLAGDGFILRLRMLEGTSVNDAAARVHACPVSTAGWKPERGVTHEQAPKYDGTGCVEGNRDPNGVWTFTFVLENPLRANGWALVPITTDNATFQIAFSPNPV